MSNLTNHPTHPEVPETAESNNTDCSVFAKFYEEGHLACIVSITDLSPEKLGAVWRTVRGFACTRYDAGRKMKLSVCTKRFVYAVNCSEVW